MRGHEGMQELSCQRRLRLPGQPCCVQHLSGPSLGVQKTAVEGCWTALPTYGQTVVRAPAGAAAPSAHVPAALSLLCYLACLLHMTLHS